MGTIGVHEFITMDGVIGDPYWSSDYPFDPKVEQAIGAIMGSSKAILPGRRAGLVGGASHATCRDLGRVMYEHP